MENKHMITYPISLGIREMQIKAVMKYHYTPTSRRAKITNTDIAKCWQQTHIHAW